MKPDGLLPDNGVIFNLTVTAPGNSPALFRSRSHPPYPHTHAPAFYTKPYAVPLFAQRPAQAGLPGQATPTPLTPIKPATNAAFRPRQNKKGTPGRNRIGDRDARDITSDRSEK
jgi:hypothetical protein